MMSWTTIHDTGDTLVQMDIQHNHGVRLRKMVTTPDGLGYQVYLEPEVLRALSQYLRVPLDETSVRAWCAANGLRLVPEGGSTRVRSETLPCAPPASAFDPGDELVYSGSNGHPHH